MVGKIAMFGFWVLLASLFSCSHQKPVCPTCFDLIGGSLSQASDAQIAVLLDQARDKGEINSCWKPLIKKCLDEKRDIPHKHVTLAIKALNKKRDEVCFHKAVLRYFQDIIRKDTIKYRQVDREFLKAYCHYVIIHAQKATDPKLLQAKDLCRHLDPDLYQHIFVMKSGGLE